MEGMKDPRFGAIYTWLFGESSGRSYEAEEKLIWPAVCIEFEIWLGTSFDHTQLDAPVHEDNYIKAMSNHGKLDDEFAKFMSEALTANNIEHELDGRRITYTPI